MNDDIFYIVEKEVPFALIQLQENKKLSLASEQASKRA
jgi:hypothetical protein